MMKRLELLKKFFDNGWWVLREGGSHTIITNGDAVEAIPRHKEINENLAKVILRRRGLK